MSRTGTISLRLLLLAAAYFAAGWLGLRLAPPELKISLVWLPTGIMVAGLYRWGLRYWPGVFLGAGVLVGYSFPVAWLPAGTVVAGQTLAPLLVAWILRRADFHPTFDRRRDVNLVVVAAVFGMMISASAGTAALFLADLLPADQFGPAWLRWWLGDVMGVLVAGPFLLSISRRAWTGLRGRGREFASWCVVAVALLGAIFFLPPTPGVGKLPLVFLPLLLTVWSALRFGSAPTSLAVMTVAIAAASGLALGRGPFLQPGIIEGVFLLWTYVGTMVVLSLMINGIEISRRDAEHELQASQRELIRANEGLRSATRRAEQASHAKGVFLANMSHELRTPMNGILGMTDLLLTSDLSAEQREFADIVRSSGHTLLRLLNDVLDLSKIEAGKIDVEPANLDLASLIEQVVRLAASSSAGRIRVDSLVAPDVPAWIRGDRDRLRQVLGNLLDNAIKFTAQGAVTLVVERVAGGLLRFSVVDTGNGIPADRLARIFEPFEQGDSSTTRRYGGTGLGLTISRRIVELMGGRLEVSSKEGAGSTFTFTLPLVAGVVGAPPPSPKRPAIPPETSVARLLLVEDNPTNQKVASLQFRRLGYEVDVVGDGAQALRRLAERRYDLVFMDCQMPTMDGYAATRAIRAGQVPGIDPLIPIVALTANVMPEDIAACHEAGMNDCLTKPLPLERLAATLERFLTIRA